MNDQEEYWVGFDLGGTKMLACVYDAELQKLGSRRRKTRGEAGQEEGVTRVIKTIDQALADAEKTRTDLTGIGIGCPSPVDMERGVLLEAVNLGWENVPIQQELESEYDCPVAVLNDVDAGVYGESQFGAASGAQTVLGVFPGTGIGGGCVYRGQIVHGKNSSCMEIGHVQIRADGHLCGCGRRGCLETEASRLAISAEVAKAAYRGETPHLQEMVEPDLPELRSGVLANAIEAGDVVIEQIVRDAAAKIGIAVANFVNLFAADCVVLGGGMVEAMPDIFVKSVHKAAVKSVLPSFADSFHTVVAELGDDASVLGAAAWARQLCRSVS
ncbi:MAG: transcriptional regulator [Planctomycetaceae bacterium]|nr:transcriptional regulator [Planctomycetaceae bacterium]